MDQTTRLEEAKQKYADWQEKIKEMKIVVQNMNGYRQQVEEKKSQDLINLKEAEEALAHAEQQLKDLQNTIAEQTTSVEEMQKINLQSKGYLESQQRFEKSIKEQTSNLFKKQTELNQVVSDLESVVCELQKVSGQIAFPNQRQRLNLQFNRETLNNTNDESGFETDLRNGKETLISIVADGEAELETSKSSIEGLLDQVNKKEVTLKQTRSKLDAVSLKVEHTKKSLSVFQERQDLCRKEMISLEDETNQALEREATIEREVIAIEAKMRRSADDHALTLSAKYREIEGSMDCIEAHLKYTDSVIANVHNDYEEKMKKVQSLSIRQDD